MLFDNKIKMNRLFIFFMALCLNFSFVFAQQKVNETKVKQQISTMASSLRSMQCEKKEPPKPNLTQDGN